MARHPQYRDSIKFLIEHFSDVSLTIEEAVILALRIEEFRREDAARAMSISIRKASRLMDSAKKKSREQKRHTSGLGLSRKTLREINDIVSKAVSSRPEVVKTIRKLRPQEDPSKYGSRPKCPKCGAQHSVSKGDRWVCGECGKQWLKKLGRKPYKMDRAHQSARYDTIPLRA